MSVVFSDAYFAKLKALAMGIEAYRSCKKSEREEKFKIVGRLLARYEAQIVLDLIDRQILDEVEKYGKEAFERANGYAYETTDGRQASGSESEEVRERPRKPRRAKRDS